MKSIVLAVAMAAVTLCGTAEAKVYQKLLKLSCTSNACTGAAPKVPKGKTLTIKTLSCAVNAAPGNSKGVMIVSIAGSNSFVQYLNLEPSISSASINGVDDVTITVKSGKQLAIILALESGQTAGNGTCGIRGTLN